MLKKKALSFLEIVVLGDEVIDLVCLARDAPSELSEDVPEQPWCRECIFFVCVIESPSWPDCIACGEQCFYEGDLGAVVERSC